MYLCSAYIKFADKKSRHVYCALIEITDRSGVHFLVNSLSTFNSVIENIEKSIVNSSRTLTGFYLSFGKKIFDL